MKTKQINKNNWSGEKAEIKVYKNSVALYGVCGCECWEHFKIKINKKVKSFIHFSVWNPNWCYPIVTGYQDLGGSWIAQAEVQRNDKCLHTAIAQVLFNTL